MRTPVCVPSTSLLEVLCVAELVYQQQRCDMLILPNVCCSSRLAVDLEDIRRFGARASVAAATGVLMPTLLTFALYSGVLGAGWKVILLGMEK